MYNYYHCIFRNSNGTVTTVNCLFIVTAYPNFTCDIPLCVSDMNEWNEINITLKTTVFLMDDRVKLIEQYFSVQI
jgi:hypothetical protein